MRAALPGDSRWRVASVGTHAVEGLPASDNAIAACAEVGVDLRAHRSRALTAERLREAAVVVTMARTHLDQIRFWHHRRLQNIFLLRSFDPRADAADVSDPIGADLAAYRSVREAIRRSIAGLLSFMEKMDLPPELSSGDSEPRC